MCSNRVLPGSLGHVFQQISQMELEIQGMPQSIRPQYTARVKTSKTELARWKTTAVSVNFEHYCTTHSYLSPLSCRKKSIKLPVVTHSSTGVVLVPQPQTSTPLMTHTGHLTEHVSSLGLNLSKSRPAGWKTPNVWLWRPRILAQTSCEA